jgi:hypothetical protein
MVFTVQLGNKTSAWCICREQHERRCYLQILPKQLNMHGINVILSPSRFSVQLTGNFALGKFFGARKKLEWK